MKNNTNNINNWILPIAAIFIALFSVIVNKEVEKNNKAEQQAIVLAQKTEIEILQKEISKINEELQTLTGKTNNNALSIEEVNRKQQVLASVKSKEDKLTDIVSVVGPSVVSIVVSKDVPKLEVVYQNPFGDDPAFKNFSFRVPVYRQKGIEKQKVGAGSGFIISADGYIVTNRHVVSDTAADYVVLLSTGENKVAKVVYRDIVNDIALLKIEGRFNPLKFGDSSKLKAGQSVVAVGNALGEYNNSVSVGIISGLNRAVQVGDSQGKNLEQLDGVIQTDAAINPGNSGGPLIDMDGNIIGVNVATVLNSNNISFSIPSNTVKTSIGKFMSF